MSVERQQLDETVQQERDGIGVRTAWITCGCGTKRALVLMYKCLYCNEWFCHGCAEEHFGETVRDRKGRKEIK